MDRVAKHTTLTWRVVFLFALLGALLSRVERGDLFGVDGSHELLVRRRIDIVLSGANI